MALASHVPGPLSPASAELVEEMRLRLVDTGPECLCGQPRDVEHVCVCECGVAVNVHPPLPKVKPLASWKSSRALSGDIGWDGRGITHPGRAAAARGRQPKRTRSSKWR